MVYPVYGVCRGYPDLFEISLKFQLICPDLRHAFSPSGNSYRLIRRVALDIGVRLSHNADDHERCVEI